MRPWLTALLVSACATTQTVSFTGIARDAKLGAVIEAGDRVVYCSGLQAWPAELSGREVTAHGRLERVESEPLMNERGEVSAGVEGPIWVLRDCRYD